MQKYMNNERGLTLIELLGAVALTAVVISAAIALFSSVTTFVHSNSDGRNTQSNAKYALSQISGRLHDSDKVFKPNGNNELRYSTFTGNYKAICYIINTARDNRTEIWLFDYTGGSFDDADISYDLDQSLYRNGRILASNVASPPTYQIETDTGLTPLTGLYSYSAGEKVHISVEYVTKRKTATGGSIVSAPQAVETSVKLYQDS